MSRQGAALLLVLGAVLAVTLAVTAALVRQGPLRLQAIDDGHERQAMILADDVEALLIETLAGHGATLRTPVDAPFQGLVVMDAQVESEPPVMVRATVWDALSGVPLAVAQQARYSRHLPAAVRRPAPPTGTADWIALPEHWQTEAENVELYPPSPWTAPDPLAELTVPLALAIGHDSDGRINVLTAPLELVEQVASAGNLPIDRGAIERARAADEPVRVVLPQVTGSAAGREPAVQLVAQTDRWSCRVNVRIGRRWWAWWLVIGADGDSGHGRVHRHRIGHGLLPSEGL